MRNLDSKKKGEKGNVDAILAELGMEVGPEPANLHDAVVMCGMPEKEAFVPIKCECGKTEYPTEVIARREAKKLLRRANVSHLRPYQCPTGGMWHLTSSHQVKL